MQSCRKRRAASKKKENKKPVKGKENQESGLGQKPREENDSSRRKSSIMSNAIKRSSEMRNNNLPWALTRERLCMTLTRAASAECEHKREQELRQYIDNSLENPCYNGSREPRQAREGNARAKLFVLGGGRIYGVFIC